MLLCLLLNTIFVCLFKNNGCWCVRVVKQTMVCVVCVLFNRNGFCFVFVVKNNGCGAFVVKTNGCCCVFVVDHTVFLFVVKNNGVFAVRLLLNAMVFVCVCCFTQWCCVFVLKTTVSVVCLFFKQRFVLCVCCLKQWFVLCVCC